MLDSLCLDMLYMLEFCYIDGFKDSTLNPFITSRVIWKLNFLMGMDKKKIKIKNPRAMFLK